VSWTFTEALKIISLAGKTPSDGSPIANFWTPAGELNRSSVAGSIPGQFYTQIAKKNNALFVWVIIACSDSDKDNLFGMSIA